MISWGRFGDAGLGGQARERGLPRPQALLENAGSSDEGYFLTRMPAMKPSSTTCTRSTNAWYSEASTVPVGRLRR